jgi:hypothetical protein
MICFDAAWGTRAQRLRFGLWASWLVAHTLARRVVRRARAASRAAFVNRTALAGISGLELGFDTENCMYIDGTTLIAAAGGLDIDNRGWPLLLEPRATVPKPEIVHGLALIPE